MIKNVIKMDEITYRQIESEFQLRSVLKENALFLRMIAGTPEKCFATVGMANDKPIAFIVCNNTRNPSELYIQFILVAEKFRKRGIASQLSQSMEAFAKEQHFLKLTLDIDKSNKAMYVCSSTMQEITMQLFISLNKCE